MQVVDFHMHFFARSFFEALAAQAPGERSVEERLGEVCAKTGIELPAADNVEHLARWRAEMERHGVEHMAAFASLPEEVPALAEADFDPFAAAVGEIQAVNGDYFAPAQDGRRFISADIARAIGYCSEQLGCRGVGQSSWGPTAFVFVPHAARAVEVVGALRDDGLLGAGLEAAICAPRNEGAVIEAATVDAQDCRAPAGG